MYGKLLSVATAVAVQGIISSSTAQSSYDLSGKYRRIISGIFLALAKHETVVINKVTLTTTYCTSIMIKRPYTRIILSNGSTQTHTHTHTHTLDNTDKRMLV